MILFSVILNFALCWDKANSPYNMLKDIETSFWSLPVSASVSDGAKLWSGYFWPHKKGGISYRWQLDQQKGEYQLYSFSELKSLSEDVINTLSPAEKFDLLQSDYTYSLTTKVQIETSKPSKNWHGICNGTSVASMLFNEPQTKTIKNKEGLSITFYSSDIKALLAYYYAKVDMQFTGQVGSRCRLSRYRPISYLSDKCRDVNPASLHLLLANKVGLRGESFIADYDPYKAVWNHPIISYSSVVLYQSEPLLDSPDATFSSILVDTQVTFAGLSKPHVNTVLGTDNMKIKIKNYKYWLFLDERGHIIGGKWDSHLLDRPDFLWVKKRFPFNKQFQVLSNFLD